MAKRKAAKRSRVSKSYNLLEPGDSNTFLLIIGAVVFVLASVVYYFGANMS